MKNVRRFSACGPCIVQGELVGETHKFYAYVDKYNGKVKKVGKRAVHIEACGSCRDHPQTCYPNGYMD